MVVIAILRERLTLLFWVYFTLEQSTSGRGRASVPTLFNPIIGATTGDYPYQNQRICQSEMDPMRIAILSDIHGNLEALEIALADIDARSVDMIICLGDLVEGGIYNDEVVELIRNYKILAVQGNHDVENDCHLKPSNQAWLNSLPEEIVENNTIFTHISPRKAKNKISNNIEAWNVFEETNQPICFIGHIHFPVIYGRKCEFFGESHLYEVDQEVFYLAQDDRYIICCGAIGYPRGGGRFIRYGIYDDVALSIEFIRLEGYLLPYGL